MSECRRCGATLRDGTLPCGACRLDRIEAHIRTLVAGAASSHASVLAAKASAVHALRSLGLTQQQLVEVRAQALDCWTVPQILERLNADAPELLEVG